jgi:hypothetical protein
MVAPAELPVIRVDRWEMRCRFNKTDYAKRAAAKQLTLRITKPDRLATPAYGQAPGSLSHEVYYIDPDTEIELARVHQFLRPDGTIGGQSKPDPH